MAEERRDATEGAVPARSGERVRPGVRQVRKPGAPRPITHKVKVTAEQEERLLERASERNVTVPRLLVESALAGGADAAKLRAEMIGELYRVARLVGKVGVNINQIARVTNATLEAQPETAAAIAAHGRVMVRLEQLLDDLDRPLPSPAPGQESAS